jgi:hypothetical protein
MDLLRPHKPGDGSTFMIGLPINKSGRGLDNFITGTVKMPSLNIDHLEDQIVLSIYCCDVAISSLLFALISAIFLPHK